MIALAACSAAGERGDPVGPGTPATDLLGPGSEASLFQIVQEESEARFSLGEVLRGQPTTVVGTTDQVAGQIALDFEDPAGVRISPVQIEAASFATDQPLRDRAINRFILQSGLFETITFTPASIAGLPDVVSIGQRYDLLIGGDLTIRDVTRAVTFEVAVTPISESRLEGLASTTIQRADFGLEIPSVPNVAGVDEAVLLELEFVAVPGTG